VSIYKINNTYALSHLQHTSVIFVCLHRCQTDPCNECEYQGQSHAVGERWRSDYCQLCHCLPNLTVQCSHYCPYTVTGCPQVREEMIASSQQTGHPPEAARLHAWDPHRDLQVYL
uniref:VWFC domain-containing protein n=1 Tax=Anabas testudineus TaxID=64144 RepID=A0A7N6AJW0_ANATE